MAWFDDDAILAEILKTEKTIARRLGIADEELAITPPQPAGGSPGQPGAQARRPSLTVNVPFLPSTLTDMLFASARSEQVGIKGVFTIQATVPAASGTTPGTYTLDLAPPAGYVTLFTSPFSVTATSYSYDLFVDLVIDGQNLTTAPYEVALGSPMTFDMARYAFIENLATITLTNYSTASSTVSGFFQVIALEQNLFRKRLWLPLISGGLALAKDVAAITQGGAP
jgi:hypothetical protein